MLLLPLLVASLPTPPAPVTVDSTAQLEALLDDAVRAAIAAGGTLIGDSGDTAMTVVDGEVATRFIAEVDELDGEGGTFRIERGAAPAQPADPDPLLVAAMSAPRGGVRIASECGFFFLEPYAVERAASGKAAGALIAEALIDADDIEWAYVTGSDRATFALTRGEDALTLQVVLGEGGAIQTAELSRIRAHADDATFADGPRLRRALRKGRVTAIDTDGDLPALRIGKARYAFRDASFAAAGRDPELDGCGC